MAYNYETGSPTPTKSTARRIGEAAGEASEVISNGAERALDNMPESVKAKGREAAENAQAVAGNFKDAMEKSTRENPVTTVVMALALGFLVGTLWR